MASYHFATTVALGLRGTRAAKPKRHATGTRNYHEFVEQNTTRLRNMASCYNLFTMNCEQPFLPQENAEDTLKKAIETVENSARESDKKLDIALLLLDKKQGAQLGNFKIAESDEEKETITKEFSEELSNILKLLNDTYRSPLSYG